MTSQQNLSKHSTFLQKIGINVCTCMDGGLRPPSIEEKTPNGDYSITVSASVCGTDSSGSIPGSRPKAKSPSGDFCVWGD